MELEQMRKSLLFAWQYSIDPPGRVDTVILQSVEQLREFADDKVAAYVARDSLGLLIVMPWNASSIGEASPERTTIQHELAHYLSSFILLRQPRWLSEGLASYLETTRPVAERPQPGGNSNGTVDV